MTRRIQNTTDLSQIEGLTFIEDFISLEEEKALVEAIDAEKWLLDLKRRVQHYGYKYDYKARRINHEMRIGELPNWSTPVAERLVQRGFYMESPDQLIINEYEPGQGISAHIDCEPCFEDTIVSISLHSDALMNFDHSVTKERVPVFLPRRCAVILQGESRYLWKHSIPARKSDKVDGIRQMRERRISMTFRRVIYKDYLAY